jgi:hypothetical protein
MLSGAHVSLKQANAQVIRQTPSHSIHHMAFGQQSHCEPGREGLTRLNPTPSAPPAARLQGHGAKSDRRYSITKALICQSWPRPARPSRAGSATKRVAAAGRPAAFSSGSEACPIPHRA